jgi:hypothetical protein
MCEKCKFIGEKMAGNWLLLGILILALIIVFGGGIFFRLVDALIAIIVLLILVGVLLYIWNRL